MCTCRLPPWCVKFFELCLMVTADHGPAVSGAHNTIVCARAGKDLVSCLSSGLLTIVRPFPNSSLLLILHQINIHSASTSIKYSCVYGYVLKYSIRLIDSQHSVK